jgi:hypothetical protein
LWRRLPLLEQPRTDYITLAAVESLRDNQALFG